VKGGNKFLISNQYIFVAKAEDFKTQDVTLWLSNTMDASFEFKQVDVPMKRLREHSYTILDTQEGQVFLHVNHQGDNSKTGNIYISVHDIHTSHLCLRFLCFLGFFRDQILLISIEQCP